MFDRAGDIRSGQSRFLDLESGLGGIDPQLNRERSLGIDRAEKTVCIDWIAVLSDAQPGADLRRALVTLAQAPIARTSRTSRGVSRLAS